MEKILARIPFLRSLWRPGVQGSLWRALTKKHLPKGPPSANESKYPYLEDSGILGLSTQIFQKEYALNNVLGPISFKVYCLLKAFWKPWEYGSGRVLGLSVIRFLHGGMDGCLGSRQELSKRAYLAEVRGLLRYDLRGGSRDAFSLLLEGLRRAVEPKDVVGELRLGLKPLKPHLVCCKDSCFSGPWV